MSPAARSRAQADAGAAPAAAGPPAASSTAASDAPAPRSRTRKPRPAAEPTPAGPTSAEPTPAGPRLPVDLQVPWEARSHVTDDGTQLWYEIAGEARPGGLDLVLGDGIGCAGFVWKYLAPALLPYGRLIHLHMRGHGRSAAPADPAAVSIERLARDWVGLLDELGSTRTAILGHSLGVQVSLELQRLDPTRPQALVLLCGSFENPVATFRDNAMLAKVLPLVQRATALGGAPLKAIWSRLIRLPAAYYVATRTELHPDLTRRGDVEAYLADLADMNPALFFRMLAQAGQHSARAHLPTIQQPTLVVSGARDQFTPARLSEEMVRLLPHGELFCLEDGAHAAPIEHPVRVSLEVLRFLERAGLKPV